MGHAGRTRSSQVLLATFDPYTRSGGVQSSTRGLIRSNPQITFCVLDSGPGRGADAPPHVEAVRVHAFHRGQVASHAFVPPSLPALGLQLAAEGGRLALLMDIAAAVAGRSFDVVEIPDQLVHGWLLPPLLKRFGVQWDKLVLSMHGTSSETLRDNWLGAEVGDLTTLESTESLLFRSCDVRYGLGRGYVGAWAAAEGRPAQALDPWQVLDWSGASRGDGFRAGPATDVDLAFVGRQERWKGPDIFLDVAAKLPRTSFERLRLYGPTTRIGDRDSLTELTRLAERSRLAIHTNRILPHRLLMDVFATERVVAVLPSRRDPFNQTAVEALLNGCPTALSSRCGAADFLRRALPGLDWVEIGADRPAEAAHLIAEVLATYDDHRSKLRDQLARMSPSPAGASLEQVYAQPSSADADARALAEKVVDRLLSAIDRTLPAQLANTRAEMLRDFALLEAETGYKGGAQPFQDALAAAAERLRVNSDPLGVEGASSPESARPQGVLAPADRASALRRRAELARARGDFGALALALIGCARLTGRADAELAEELGSALEALGLVEEGRVARMRFTPGRPGLHAYLQDRLASLPTAVAPDVLHREESRNAAAPRLTIVAVAGTEVALSSLAALSRKDREDIELVLVDGPSGFDDAGSAQSRIPSEGLSGLTRVRVRVAADGPVQRMWSCGLRKARGEFVLPLGPGEAVVSAGVSEILQRLRADPRTDWFHVSGLANEPVSVYRRSLHDSLGGYDDTFRAAAREEWSARAFGRVVRATLTQPLVSKAGGEASESDDALLAELESVRADVWLRTAEGCRCVLADVGDAACGDLLLSAAGIGAEAAANGTTDLDMAAAVGGYLRDHRPGAFARTALAFSGAGMVLEGYRLLDEVSPEGAGLGWSGLEHDMNSVKSAARLVTDGAELLQQQGARVVFRVHNDERHRARPELAVQARIDPGPPIEVADLAGATTLSEVLLASGAYAQRLGTDERLRLGRLQRFDAWLPVPPLSDPFFPEVLRALPSGVEVLVTGVVDRTPLVHRRLHLAGPVADDRRMGEVADVALLPAFDLPSGRALLGQAVRCLWRGLPTVMGVGVAQALSERFPGLVVEEGAVAAGPQDLGARLLALMDTCARAQRLAPRIGSDLSGRLAASGVVWPPMSPPGPALWNPVLRQVGRAVRDCARGSDGAADALGLVLERRSEPAYRATADAVVRALLVDRDATLLHTGAALSDVVALPTLPTVEAGYALLQLLGAEPSDPHAAMLAAGLRLRSRPAQSRTELDAWLDQDLREEAPEGPPVVLASRPFWSSVAGRRLQASPPDGWLLGVAPSPADDATPDLLRSRRLDRALVAARLVVLLADEHEPPSRVGPLWMRGAALSGALLGTRAALGFAAPPDTSCAVLPSVSEALAAASAACLEGRSVAMLRREREEMLERLGVSAQRTPVIRLAA